MFGSSMTGLARCRNRREEIWEIAEDRYQTRSMILTSQLPVSRWHETDRRSHTGRRNPDGCVHNAHRIEMRGDSMRQKTGEKEKSDESAGQKLWKRRARTSAWNRRSDVHFPKLQTTTSLTIAITFNKRQKPRFGFAEGLIGSPRNIDRDHSGMLCLHRNPQRKPSKLRTRSRSPVSLPRGNTSGYSRPPILAVLGLIG